VPLVDGRLSPSAADMPQRPSRRSINGVTPTVLTNGMTQPPLFRSVALGAAADDATLDAESEEAAQQRLLMWMAGTTASKSQLSRSRVDDGGHGSRLSWLRRLRRLRCACTSRSRSAGGPPLVPLSLSLSLSVSVPLPAAPVSTHFLLNWTQRPSPRTRRVRQLAPSTGSGPVDRSHPSLAPSFYSFRAYMYRSRIFGGRRTGSSVSSVVDRRSIAGMHGRSMKQLEYWSAVADRIDVGGQRPAPRGER
jgi:hypothetical protein